MNIAVFNIGFVTQYTRSVTYILVLNCSGIGRYWLLDSVIGLTGRSICIKTCFSIEIQ